MNHENFWNPRVRVNFFHSSMSFTGEQGVRIFGWLELLKSHLEKERKGTEIKVSPEDDYFRTKYPGRSFWLHEPEFKHIQQTLVALFPTVGMTANSTHVIVQIFTKTDQIPAHKAVSIPAISITGNATVGRLIIDGPVYVAPTATVKEMHHVPRGTAIASFSEQGAEEAQPLAFS